MKKLLGVSTLLFAAIVSVKAQTEVLFKIKMLPNRTYSSTMKMDMNMEMNYDGDAATMDKIKASGVKMPIIMQMQSGMNADIKTGSVNKNNYFPFSMSMQQLEAKMTMSGQPSPMPPTSAAIQTMYGKCPIDGLMEIDSIPGTAMNDSLKITMRKLMKSIQASVEFPTKPMKVGDTFTQESPFDIPMAGMNAKMKMKAIYKLISIANGKANFDMNFTMSMDMGLGGQGAMDMKGDGDGKMVYDMATNYPSDSKQNVNMLYSMAIPQQKMSMKGTLKMQMDQQTVVK
jgi:hypothetical protein